VEKLIFMAVPPVLHIECPYDIIPVYTGQVKSNNPLSHGNRKRRVNMRKRRRRAKGVSLGTISALVLTALVAAGCAFLFPKLMGDVQLRIDPQRVSVAIGSSLQAISGNLTITESNAPSTTPATAPPLNIAAPSEPLPSSTAEPGRALSLTVTGAISLDTAIQKACTSAEGYAFGPVFEALSSNLKSNINLATLENLVVGGEKLTDINMPSDALSALSATGFNVLCDGFPSALDLGVTGLQATLSTLSTAGVTAYGVYPTAESREHATVLQVQNITVAFLSFQNELSSASQKNTSKEEQAFAVAPLSLPEIAAGIDRAHSAGAQIVLVSLRWGKSGADEPTDSQRELAQGIANAGADIILGTGAGSVQAVEMLTATRKDSTSHQVLCAYSLGNLLASDRSKRDTISGVLLHIAVIYDLAADSLSFDRLTYTPTYVWRDKQDGKTFYRVVPSNANAPQTMSTDQRNTMQRSLKLIEDRLSGSALTQE
jgi:poly-gamma-glutamate capsule biosynthesis protein CapA/YwtB (metallophosphatase superfamily)